MAVVCGVQTFRSSLCIALEAGARSRLHALPLEVSRCYSTTRPPPPPRLWTCHTRRATPLLLCARKPLSLLSPLARGARTIFSGGITTRYIDLPPDYSDEEGLPFRKTELDQNEVNSIFGGRTSVYSANKLLRILHGRRVAGTVDDPSLSVNTSHYTSTEKDKAFAYLRKHVPVDEVVNAGLRAEDELRELTGEVEAEAEDAVAEPNKKLDYSSRYKLYKDDSDAPRPEDVYGEGAFDRIRARNRAKDEKRERERAEAQKQREEELARLRPGGLQTVDANQPRQLSPRMQNYVERATSDLKEPPNMPAWERLLPSTVFALLFAGALVTYAKYYEPPARGDRLWPDIPPAAATCLALIGLNLLGALLWRLPPAWGLLNRYFIVVAATPKPLSLLGAAFSHQKMGHLLMNMAALWFIAPRLHDDLGRGNFLALYLSAGVFGFLGSLYTLVLRGRLAYTTLGASGGVYGITAAYFWMHRFEAFKILGLPPDPYNGVQGLGFLGLIIALNLAVLVRRRTHNIDVMSHFAGLAVGVAAAHFFETKEKEKAAQRLKPETGDRRPTDLGVGEKVVQNLGKK